MEHLPILIQDLGLILMAAAVMTLLFKQLRQPIVLGYLIAGFLVGPHFRQFPVVQDLKSIEIWSEIGVIFMLFGLGLEFSFKKLVNVGKTASITATFEIFAMILVGFVVGRMFGWSTMSSLFLGAILSMSSTTIIVKAFDEQHLKGRSFAPIVFGVLIVEDLIAILLLVLLGSIAVTQRFSGGELLYSSIQLIFFLILWFILGIYILPAFLRYCRKLLTDEILLIVSIALCFMMVSIAVRVGFSAALGAFVMGSLLAETSKGTKIEHLTLPVKNLFSAIFFVSVGMLIDPTVIWSYFDTILIIVAITIIGKFFGTAIGALISGCTIKNSMQAGMSMAQIGEFSFIIATLGKSLHVTDDFLYPIAVAVSAVTTFTTPYLIKSSDSVAGWLNSRIPERLHLLLLRYETAMTDSGRESVLSLLWKVHGIKIVPNSVMVITIALAVRYAAVQFLGENFFQEQPTLESYIACLVAVFCSVPFLWAVFVSGRPRPGDYDTQTLATLQRLQIGVSVIRLFIGCILVGLVISNFTSIYALSGFVLIPVVVTVVLLFSRHFEPLYNKIENRFVSHLTDKEQAEIQARAKLSGLVPWNVSLTEFELSQYSPLVAQSLQNSRLKQQFGVTVAMIDRGGNRLIPPKSDDLLLPFDKIYLIGTDEQLTAAQKVIETKNVAEPDFDEESFGLVSLVLNEEHPFVSKKIRDCGLREAVNGLIVGIERNETRYLNPEPNMILLADDVLWLVGDKGRIKKVQRQNNTLEN
ncbi:MAG: cation:proton antiporter [Planctomycetaceae bacterium]|jgi:CPA2 family monovalent cation:H+ antiporter-2|nr:cation:proton antiporter [Planctomycetaceae bacterium]